MIIKLSKYIILLGLLYMPIFGFLDTKPIRIWDESRLAVNAYEMYKDGNIIVTHYQGKPDMWNTKPPLLIWMQAGLMHFIGVNELAVRLPSAIAAFLVCIFLLFFSIKYLKSFWFGFIIIMILITSHGYINTHATRTGDYDSLLTLFTTLSSLMFFYYLETKRNKHLYLFFIFLALAVLTKSIVGLLFTPALLIYATLKGKISLLIKNKHTYIGFFVFVSLILGYYLWREKLNPGYIAAIFKNELGGRYLDVLENHKHSFWYYYNNFINFQFKPWYLLFPVGVITGFFIKNKQINNLTLFSLLNVLVFFLIISTSKTKLEWYDVPLYPFISILSGISIYSFFLIFENMKIPNKIYYKNILPFIFLFLILIIPYRTIINKTYKPQEYPWDKNFYAISYYLKDAVKGKNNVNNTKLIYDNYSAHLLFYLNILQDKGINISISKKENIRIGDKILCSKKNISDYIKQNFKFKILYSKNNIKIYEINERKQ